MITNQSAGAWHLLDERITQKIAECKTRIAEQKRVAKLAIFRFEKLENLFQTGADSNYQLGKNCSITLATISCKLQS